MKYQLVCIISVAFVNTIFAEEVTLNTILEKQKIHSSAESSYLSITSSIVFKIKGKTQGVKNIVRSIQNQNILVDHDIGKKYSLLVNNYACYVESQDSSYILKSPVVKSTREDFFKKFVVYQRCLSPNSFFGTGISIHALLADNSMTNLTIGKMDNGFVFLTFLIPPSAIAPSLSTKYILQFDASAGFTLANYNIVYTNIETKLEKRDTGTRRYIIMNDYPLVVSESTKTYIAGSSSVYQTFDTTYEYSGSLLHSSDKFSMTTYGIDLNDDEDAEIFEDRPFNWFFWGGLGACCIIVSIMLRIHIRNKQAV